MAQWNMFAGWAGMLLGLISGSVIGLFFHQADFAGGYGAFRRRLLRLGHIAFFGLGIINVLFSLALSSGSIQPDYPVTASLSLIAGAALMPTICFLTAWKAFFRHAFALPVICVAITIVLVLQKMVIP